MATAGDAASVSEAAAMMFRDTYAAFNDPADMDRYVAEAFSADRQRAEIDDPSGFILVVEDDASIMGYAHLGEGPTPAVVTDTPAIEIKRFYIDRALQGKGAAHQLMQAVLDESRKRGARTIWLGVWTRNPRAIAFYGKFGFEAVGQQTFMLGRDAQTDWILARAIP
jgi:diamine N-acetyltransferase